MTWDPERWRPSRLRGQLVDAGAVMLTLPFGGGPASSSCDHPELRWHDARCGLAVCHFCGEVVEVMR